MTEKKYYTLIDIAGMTAIDAKIILLYEDEGLISPVMEGGQKCYTADDLEQVKMIRRLTDELGVNLPGVAVILNMRQQIIGMQRDFEEIIARMKSRLTREFRDHDSRSARRLIESKSGKVIKVEIKD